MKSSSRIAVVGVIAIILGTCAWIWMARGVAGSGARSIVITAMLKDRDLNYSGTVVTSAAYGGKMIVTRANLYHSGKRERINYLEKSLHGAYMIDSGGTSYSCVPSMKKLVVSHGGELLTEREHIALLLLNYRMKLIGNTVIADRSAYEVSIIPRKPGRGSKKLWIDRERRVVLKSEDYSADGRLRSRMEFMRIRFDQPTPDALFAAPVDASFSRDEVCRRESREELSKKLGIDVREPGYVPVGYKFDGYSLYNCPCNCGHVSAQLAYTDGLNSFSVFLVPAKVSCGMGGVCDVKPNDGNRCIMQDSRMAKLCKTRAADKSVVVVGDLSENEIRTITESVR